MKIIVILFLVNFLFNCKSTEVIESKWTPSQTEGCISQKNSNDRLRCISNWIRSQEKKQNSVVESTETEIKRINQRQVEVKYSHCVKNVESGQVFECLNHQTSKYKPTKFILIYDTVEPIIILIIGILIGGAV